MVRTTIETGVVPCSIRHFRRGIPRDTLSNQLSRRTSSGGVFYALAQPNRRGISEEALLTRITRFCHHDGVNPCSIQPFQRGTHKECPQTISTGYSQGIPSNSVTSASSTHSTNIVRIFVRVVCLKRVFIFNKENTRKLFFSNERTPSVGFIFYTSVDATSNTWCGLKQHNENIREEYCSFIVCDLPVEAVLKPLYD